MGLTLEEIKLYLKIDTEFEDNLLLDLQSVAENYLEEAGIKKNYAKPTYKMCIKILIAHYYANRSITVEGTKYLEEIPFGVRSFIQQLQIQEVV